VQYRNLDVLVPVDFSEPSFRAVELAVSLVAASGSGKLTLFHVNAVPDVAATALGVTSGMSVQLLNLRRDLAQRQEEALQRVASDRVPDDMPVTCMVRAGYGPGEILSQVEEGGHRLVVMGTRGLTGIERVMLGSTAARVMAECPVPVLVTH